MTNKNILLLLIVLCALLIGCVDTRILERTGFIQVLSLDLLPNGKTKYAVSVPTPDPQVSSERIFMKTVALTSKEARLHMARQTNLLLVSGQLRTALFGIDLAKQGVIRKMDPLVRDPTVSEQVRILVVNGDAESLLVKDYPKHPQTGRYIDRLVEKEAKFRRIPDTTIYSFMRDYYDDGIDPVAPMIKNRGHSIAVDGVSIFRDDKYVGKIDIKDSLLLSLLRGRVNQGEISVDLSREMKKGEVVMLGSIDGKRKIKVTRDQHGRPHVHIKVKVLASVLEYLGGENIGDDQFRHKMEQALSKTLTKQAEKVISFLQEKNADSLGVGMYVRNSMTYEDWKKLNWRVVYPQLRVTCELQVTIKDYGYRI